MDLATGILIALVIVGTISSITLILSIWNYLKIHSCFEKMDKFGTLISEQDKRVGEYKSAFLEIRDEIIPETRKNFELALFSGGDENSPIYATSNFVAKIEKRIQSVESDLGAYRDSSGVLSLARPENIPQDVVSREDFGKLKNDLPVIVGKILEAIEDNRAFQASPLAPLGEKGLSPKVGLTLVGAGFSLEKIASLKKGDESWDKFIGALGKDTDSETLIQVAREVISEVEKRRELDAESAAFKKHFLTGEVDGFNFSVWKKCKEAEILEPKDFGPAEKSAPKFAKLAEIFGDNDKALEAIRVAKEAVKKAKVATKEIRERVPAETALVSETPSPAADATTEIKAGGRQKTAKKAK